MITLAFAVLFTIAIFGYILNVGAARAMRDRGTRLQSIVFYHGFYAFLIVLCPVLAGTLGWLALRGPVIEMIVVGGLPDSGYSDLDTGARQLVVAEIESIADGRIFGTPEQWKIDAAERLSQLRHLSSALLVACAASAGLALVWFARSRVRAEFRARQGAERIVMALMMGSSAVAVLATVGIVASLLLETGRFFSMVPMTEFLFGLNWEPQIPMREDQIAAEGAFGWIPVILGTLVITVVALLVAVPVGLLSAIYLNEFAPPSIRAVAKPVLEILAGVPTVVYGFFAILTIAPAVRSLGEYFGIGMAPNTALAAGGVMGVMLIPFISSFSDDALSAVPRDLRDGALALGATRAEAMLGVLFPAAVPGIAGGILLAVSRAIGETMIVVMAAGLIAKLTINPLESVTTMTVQIMTLLIGDTSFDNPKTLAAFALGTMLFFVTLMINVFALGIIRKYREIYE